MYSFNLIYFNRNDNILFNISSKGYFTSSKYVSSLSKYIALNKTPKAFSFNLIG